MKLGLIRLGGLGLPIIEGLALRRFDQMLGAALVIVALALALDGPDRTTVLAWAAAAAPSVAVMKVGLETFLRDGASVVDDVRAAAPACGLFLDLKLHDIPNTVGKAVQALRPLEPAIITVHASGGRAMLEDAKAIA